MAIGAKLVRSLPTDRLTLLRTELERRHDRPVPPKGLDAFLDSIDPAEVVAAMRLVCLHDPEAFPQGASVLAELVDDAAQSSGPSLHAKLDAQLSKAEPPSRKAGRWRGDREYLDGAIRHQLGRVISFTHRAHGETDNEDLAALTHHLLGLLRGPPLAHAGRAVGQIMAAIQHIDGMTALPADTQAGLNTCRALLLTLGVVIDPTLVPQPASVNADGAPAIADRLLSQLESSTNDANRGILAPVFMVLERVAEGGKSAAEILPQIPMMLQVLPSIIGGWTSTEDARAIADGFRALLEGAGLPVDTEALRTIASGGISKPSWPVEIDGTTWTKLEVLHQSPKEKRVRLSGEDRTLDATWSMRGGHWRLTSPKDKAEQRLVTLVTLSLGTVRGVVSKHEAGDQNRVHGVEIEGGGIAYVRANNPERWRESNLASLSPLDQMFSNGSNRDLGTWLFADALGFDVGTPIARLSDTISIAAEVPGFTPLWNLTAQRDDKASVAKEVLETSGCSARYEATGPATAEAFDAIDLLILLTNNLDASGLNVGLDRDKRPRVFDGENAFILGMQALHSPGYYDRGRTKDIQVPPAVRDQLASWTKEDVASLLEPTGLGEAVIKSAFDRVRYVVHLADTNGGAIPRAACVDKEMNAFLIGARGE